MNQVTKTPSSVLALCRELDVKIICLRFTDLLGKGRVVRIPFSELKDESFEYGFGLNPSGIPCVGPQGSGDALLVPQAETSFFDPFAPIPTLNLLCGLQDPVTREDLKSDARSVAIKAMAYIASCGFADKATVGAELEFHLVPDDRISGKGGSRAEHEFGFWESANHPRTGADEGAEDFLQHNRLDIQHFENAFAYLNASGEEDFSGLIYASILKHLTACKVQIDTQRLRCSIGNWLTIGIRGDDPVRAADGIMVAKYVIRSMARRFRRKAVFMPKLGASARGCGMPINVSFYRGSEPLLAGAEYGGLSPLGLGAIGGLIKHLPSLCGLVSPSTNSYRRLSDIGREDCPAYATYSRGMQRAAVRVPEFSTSPRNKRIEFACPDATSNPYIAISATLMAMLEGAQNKTEPGSTPDQLTQEDNPMVSFETVPQCLEDALASLEVDHDYLTRGGVFAAEVIESWIGCKRRLEVDHLRRLPHPSERDTYGDF